MLNKLNIIISLTFVTLPVWAAGENPGIPNFHRVNEQIYRGGQPADQAWSNLAKMGVKVVIDLRREGEHSTQAEASAVTAAGMRYVNVPLNGLSAPPKEAVDKVLSLLNSGQPVFVHCRQGRDRTGTMIACYRITHDAWENRKALEEAKSYGIHWFEGAMKNYIMGFKRAVQPPTIEAGLAPAVAAN